ncbi:hypothetical protein FA95DRAFT_1588044 [Auriscalpium vulgare]|uniref:Uncharacterized protein n=1 Tax=Auriscalpium vulgare TaxID=40419 RepID=A0ACB8RZZ7_9AGAM|nr:hypothetical protein FA95DRAFT_1588044 [Auriscalpium vulgare]
MAELSNNPFIDHNASVASRFPSLAPEPSSPPPLGPTQYNSWQQQQQQPSPYPQSTPSFLGAQPTGYPQQFSQPQQQWPQQQQASGFQSPQPPYSPGGFQPSTSFGQQLVGQVNALNTGYPQQQQQQQQYTGYPQQYANGGGFMAAQPTGYPQQQQPYAGNSALAQFDPYANLAQLNAPPPQAQGGGGGYGAGGGGFPEHPRGFIQTHKAELEAWDPTTWKQALNTFDALKAAWETRRRAAESRVRALGGQPGAAASGGGFFGGGQQQGYGGYGGGYGQQGYGGYQTPQQQEVDRLNVVRHAVRGRDTVAASALQLSEVKEGYRHSGDLASKRRVREASNAALTGLPDYPPSTL